MKKLLRIVVLGLLLSESAYANEEVFRCDLSNKIASQIRAEVEINLDKNMLWVDANKYNIILLGERKITAESDNGNIKISIDRFDGYMSFQTAGSSAGFVGYCKKFYKLF